MVKFSTNPVLFKINYINKDRFDTTMGISGVLGSAFHQAMEVYYGGSDTLIPSNESEAIEYGMKAGMDYLDKYNDGFISYSKTIPNKQKAFDLFTFCFQSYIKEHPYNPDTLVSVEEEIEERIDIVWKGKKLSLPVKMKGRLDKVEKIDNKLKIKDYKTCYSFSDPEKIDGSKIIQSIVYYLLAYAKFEEEPYSVIFEEVKYSKNSDGTSQVRQYEIVYAENELYFDFFFRFYEDMIRALNGQMVYVPNVNTLYDNEVSIISYIHRLDIEETTAELLKLHKVENLTELLKKEIQSAGNMRKLMKTLEENFTSAKNLNYDKMKNEEKIQTKLMEHGMMLQFDSKIEGSTVDLYRYTPSIGLKMSRVRNYVHDIEQVLGISGVRVLAPIQNSTMVGFEVPRADRKFPDVPAGNDFNIAIGQTIMGEPRRFDIRQAPHLLIAGASGSGKSVFLGTLIEQLSRIPNTELHLFDPKRVELAMFKDKATEYQYDGKEIAVSLKHLVNEMNSRYEIMAQKGVRKIEEMTDGKFKYKFVVIDEFGDLILHETINATLLELVQKARACGIHVIIATQRPSTKIISGDIKANFPIKIVFRTAKSVDSRVVMDEEGAEKLLGKGDMLFTGDHGVERLQGYNL